MNQLAELKIKWQAEGVNVSTVASEDDVALFEIKHDVSLPDDMIGYFKLLNGTGGDCAINLYAFYSIHRIKNVVDAFRDQDGVPSYKNLASILPDSDGIYVFADFQFNFYAYGIRLYSRPSVKNEVFVLCGDAYKQIADSFSEFIDLYMANSIALQL